MSEKRRSFYGWGFAEEAISPEELGWFERAWSKVFGVDGFEAVPMPREAEITLLAPRVAIHPPNDENSQACRKKRSVRPLGLS